MKPDESGSFDPSLILALEFGAPYSPENTVVLAL